MNKNVLIVVGVILLVVGLMYLNNGDKATSITTTPDQVNVETVNQVTPASQRAMIEDGAYQVDTTKSIVNWSGKKPLQEGYINSGTLALTEGSVTVSGTGAEGSFIIDMKTLKVGLTAKKPDQETALEGHLKSDRWFDVAGHPTATFVINSVTQQGDMVGNFNYEIQGDLTLKGETHPVTFPAVIYLDAEGALVAEAATEIDRTLWGITAGSDSFFDNLADNAIDNMISLSFYLVATKE